MNASALKNISQDCWVNRALPAYDDAGRPNFMDPAGELIEGIYLDVPNEIYHSLDALSSSSLKKFAECPAKYYRQYISALSRNRTLQQTRTLDAGTYGHELCLEPDGFYDRYFRDIVPADFPDALVTNDDISKALSEAGQSTREGKKEKTNRIKRLLPNTDVKSLSTTSEMDILLEKHGFSKTETKLDKAHRLMESDPNAIVFDYLFEQNRLKNGSPTTVIEHDGTEVTLFGGKKPIDGIVWDDAHRVQQTVRAHAEANLHLSAGLPEVTIIARCPMTGMMLKSKFDWLKFNNDATDLKTTRSAHPADFRSQLFSLSYDLQQVFYCYVASLAGINIQTFTFVAVEYLNADICQPYQMPPNWVTKAQLKLSKMLSEFDWCKRTNKWYGYTKEDTTIIYQ
ncbi:PD-(D/E)XK nuclease-like domain-containing protein [Pseudoalteromonas sp.]|uniref:PD-(D/E)XK nuclease-like domain-containing protein n=1 Tax=Pseudoalteromonas sp. TaxID=53249 RepID=UPI00262F2120|nr:PD-(D/E)XK nuclease-like domain-containing protein [Pseudoalteromonas sp.]MCP4589080.1 hypothetical protein [Pseudoalteromonas sp.]